MNRKSSGDRSGNERRVADGWALLAVLAGAGTALALGIPAWPTVQSEANPTVVIFRSAPVTESELPGDVPVIPDLRQLTASHFGIPVEGPGPGVLVVEPGDVAGVPFAVSSLSSSFSVRGRYAGSVSWTPDGRGIRVRIESGRLAVSRGSVGGNHLEGIRVGLARKTDRGWSVVRSSRLHRLDHQLQDGESLAVRPFELVIPGVGESDLLDGWLVVTHELTVVPDEAGGSAGPAWTYVHGEPELLSMLIEGC